MLLSSVIVASLLLSEGFVAAGDIGERRLVTWQKQALYGDLSKQTGIGHSIRHKVEKLLPDGKSQLAVVGIITEGVIRP
jgi:hypothetical protein